jgi:hypothetical protein
MGPYIINIFQYTYIQQVAILHSLFYMETALHVSRRTSTHHQERKLLYLQRDRPWPTALLPPRSNGKPEAATAVDKLLMMGMRMSKTCWAVFKRQAINMRDLWIWLVDLFECIYSIWYLSHRYCYLPLSLISASIRSTVPCSFSPQPNHFIGSDIPISLLLRRYRQILELTFFNFHKLGVHICKS